MSPPPCSTLRRTSSHLARQAVQPLEQELHLHEAIAADLQVRACVRRRGRAWGWGRPGWNLPGRDLGPKLPSTPKIDAKALSGYYRFLEVPILIEAPAHSTTFYPPKKRTKTATPPKRRHHRTTSSSPRSSPAVFQRPTGPGLDGAASASSVAIGRPGAARRP